MRAVTGESRDPGDLRERIHDGRNNGQSSKSAAFRLPREADIVGGMAVRFVLDGLSDAEQR